MGLGMASALLKVEHDCSSASCVCAASRRKLRTCRCGQAEGRRRVLGKRRLPAQPATLADRAALAQAHPCSTNACYPRTIPCNCPASPVRFQRCASHWDVL